jgi:tRNA-specific adenosine deaminase 3
MSNIQAPPHLNNLGLRISYIEGKGRGVVASEVFPAQTLLEVSPILLFTREEYEAHGKHTVLDEYAFCWPGKGSEGGMALALGIGGLRTRDLL